MKNSIVIRVFMLGVFAIIGIIGIQSYWVVSTWNINEQEFNKKVNLALYNVAKSLADLNNGTLPPRNIIKQRSSNYYVVNIEDEIDANHLELFLQTEFEARALNVDFEYAVFDCTTDEMVYGNYCGYSPDEKKAVKLGHLPKYDEFTYYFGVKFPTRSGYLFGKIQLSIFFSIILFFTILFFAYSMFVILQQKRHSDMQKDFINNMTHEFKTPISTIQISSEVFLNNPLIQNDQRLFQYAHIVKDQNQRLNHQVEKVLQLAKIDSRSFELNREKTDLREVLEKILNSVVLQIEKMNGKLSHSFENGSHMVLADQLHLTNILHNLIDNAVKYCPSKPQLNIYTTFEDKYLTLNIQDNGIGISKEYQNRIFDKFYRIPTGNIHNVKGFGLGLFYVKSICDAHGWKIKLESESGKGTLVKVRIPRC